MDEKITVRSMIDQKVFWDFSNFSTFGLSWRGWGLLAGFPIFMIIMGIFNFCTDGFWLGIGFILVGIIYPITYLLYYRKTINAQVKKFNLATAQNFYTCVLDTTGVHVTNATDTAFCAWDKVWRCYHVPGYIYLFAAKTRGFILPIVDIENASEADLLALLTTHLSAAQWVERCKK